MKLSPLMMLVVPVVMTLSSPAQQLTLHADVPFDFAAGGTTLPAGAYTVQRAGHPSSILIRSDDGQKVALLLTNPATAALNDPVLAFERDGDKYILVKVSTGDGGPGLATVGTKSHEITVPLQKP